MNSYKKTDKFSFSSICIIGKIKSGGERRVNRFNDTYTIKREIDGKEVAIKLTEDEQFEIFRAQKFNFYCQDVATYIKDNKVTAILEHPDSNDLIIKIANELDQNILYKDMDFDDAMDEACSKVVNSIERFLNDISR